ncbi:MAG: hypothetical protein E6G45_13135 [Actinobacteria bacterium]|nr:MAG: hypothetical protein E6G45_13135 [Actinomycetota bacterium]
MTAPKKLLVALLLVAVGLVFAATGGATGKYTDPSGDNGSAPDLTGVTVSSDKASGQIIFRIDGKNISSSENYPTFLDIDSDANPLTGDVMGGGEDYFFVVDNSSYWFAHWNGSDWVDTSSSTVRVFGTSTGIMISVNKSDLGNSSNLNFSATAFDWPNKKYDSAPDDGMYNYSLDDGGPSILAVVLQTSPASGPKAGKPFVVTPTGLTPEGRRRPRRPRATPAPRR